MKKDLPQAFIDSMPPNSKPFNMGHAPIFLAFAALVSLFLCSCHRAKQEDCIRHIREKIVLGSTAQLAESELKNCGFKVSFDREKKSLYGDKTVPGAVVSERTQVTVNLDTDNKVSGVVVTTGLIGP